MDARDACKMLFPPMTDAMPAALLTLLPPGLSAPDYLWMGALVLAGACLQGVGGIGFAMLCAPLGAIFFPELVPGPLLAMGCCLSLMGALREREAIVWPVAGFALVGRAVGGAAAVLTIAWLAPGPLAVLFSLSILVAVALSLLGWRLLPVARNVVIAGTLSGFMGTITSAGAPPFALARNCCWRWHSRRSCWAALRCRTGCAGAFPPRPCAACCWACARPAHWACSAARRLPETACPHGFSRFATNPPAEFPCSTSPMP